MPADIVARNLGKRASAATVKTHGDDDIKTGSASGRTCVNDAIAAQQDRTLQNIPVAGFIVVADFGSVWDGIGWWYIGGAAPQIPTVRRFFDQFERQPSHILDNFKRFGGILRARQFNDDARFVRLLSNGGFRNAECIDTIAQDNQHLLNRLVAVFLNAALAEAQLIGSLRIGCGERLHVFKEFKFVQKFLRFLQILLLFGCIRAEPRGNTDKHVKRVLSVYLLDLST